MSAILNAILSHWSLVLRLSRREIENRYRGSFVGVAWLVLTPLAMLAVFTFVFSRVFASSWPGVTDTRSFALVLFAGLVVFQFFSELVIRAPGLFLEDKSYVTKVVFPLEVLPVVAVLSAGVSALMSFAMLLAAYFLLIGTPPWESLLVPVVLAPFIVLTLGLIYLLASLGVFLRDLKQVMPWVVQVLMFLGPVFYPLSRLPENIRGVVYLNPLSITVEELRGVLFLHKSPDPIALWGYTLVACIVLLLGVAAFRSLRGAFADVV